MTSYANFDIRFKNHIICLNLPRTRKVRLKTPVSAYRKYHPLVCFLAIPFCYFSWLSIRHILARFKGDVMRNLAVINILGKVVLMKYRFYSKISFRVVKNYFPLKPWHHHAYNELKVCPWKGNIYYSYLSQIKKTTCVYESCLMLPVATVMNQRDHVGFSNLLFIPQIRRALADDGSSYSCH